MSPVCSNTGFVYTEGPVTGYRVAQKRFGPVRPLERRGGMLQHKKTIANLLRTMPAVTVSAKPADRSQWSRFDAPGWTVYLAEDREIAYAETLSLLKAGNQFRASAAHLAGLFGVSLEEAQQMVREDWKTRGWPLPGDLADEWREHRHIYTLRIEGADRWVDLTDHRTIAALNRDLGADLVNDFGGQQITLHELTGENRDLTTYVAEWVQDQQLDDGSHPVGVKAHSKYGSGQCWAYWMPRCGHEADTAAVTVVEKSDIESTDPDLQSVLELYGLNL